MIVAHNRRWLAEADRQGWSLEDVTLLFGSLSASTWAKPPSPSTWPDEGARRRRAGEHSF
jgi:hypothetical protein